MNEKINEAIDDLIQKSIDAAPDNPGIILIYAIGEDAKIDEARDALVKVLIDAGIDL